ncbi:ATP-binding cassette domain-containing protein [Bacteriovoracales bacterium]|nr:ATP-binding cassette domain-containing protein [Bacteriovoracales bacterium]
MNLDLKNLTIKNEKTHFHNISFSFKTGNLYFCKGIHGIGKTSLINCLIGLEAPVNGDIYYGSTNFYKDGREARYMIRQNMGIIFDKPGLLSNLSIFENLKLRFSSIKKRKVFHVLGKEKDLEIEDIIKRELKDINLEDKKDLRPHLLSHGQLRKVAISRAFLSSPKILIWDDSFEGLSRRDQSFYEKKILELKKEKGLILCFGNSWISKNENLIDETIDLNNWRFQG